MEQILVYSLTENFDRRFAQIISKSCKYRNYTNFVKLNAIVFNLLKQKVTFKV